MSPNPLTGCTVNWTIVGKNLFLNIFDWFQCGPGGTVLATNSETGNLENMFVEVFQHQQIHARLMRLYGEKIFFL